MFLDQILNLELLPTVIPNTLPTFLENTKKLRALPAREGGKGANTGKVVAAKSIPIPIETTIGIADHNECELKACTNVISPNPMVIKTVVV